MKKKSGFKFEDIVRQNIIKILAEKGIQQKEIAEKMNKHPQQINNALRKRTTIINLIPEFANCLGVDEMVLFQPLNNISICQKIYEVCNDLPEQWQKEILEYAEYIHDTKYNRSGGATNAVEGHEAGRQQQGYPAHKKSNTSYTD
jgi:DNA-binding transcriptional MerR regulator